MLEQFLKMWPMLIVSLVAALIMFLILSRGTSFISWVTILALIITHVAVMGHHYGETSHVTMTMIGALWVWIASNTRDSFRALSCYASLLWEGKLKTGRRVKVVIDKDTSFFGKIAHHDAFSLSLDIGRGQQVTLSNSVVFSAHKIYTDTDD